MNTLNTLTKHIAALLDHSAARSRCAALLSVFGVIVVAWATPAIAAAAPGVVVKRASDKPAGAERVLHFPKDRSLGMLQVLDAGIKRQIKDFYQWIDGTEDKWVYLGEAQGDVTAPAGKRVRLIVNKDACADLSPLARLGADDLYELSLSYTPADDRCMPHVGRLTGLSVLGLRETDVTDAGLQHLRGMKSLERLALPKRLTDAGMVHIGRLHSLKGLYFASNRVTDAGLAHLAGLTALEELSLGGRTQDAEGKPLPSLMTGAGLAQLAKLPRLWYLNLWGDYTDADLVHFKRIPSLRTLSLSHLPITDAGLRHLSGLAGLETLDLYGTQVTDAGLVHLKSMRSLRRLYLRKKAEQADPKNLFFTDKGMEDLKEIQTLEYVAIPADGISDRGLATLAQLGHLKRLELPMPHWNDPKNYRSPYTEEGLKKLAEVQSLEQLELGGPGVTDAALAQVARLANLRSLLLFACPISNEGLAKLAACKSLEALTLMGSNKQATFSISGLNRLNGLSRLTNLRVDSIACHGGNLDIPGLVRLECLSLTGTKGCEFRDEDLACLANLKQLKRLHIGGPASQPITDAGMAHLAGLTAIENLGIGGTGVTDRGLVCLAGMRRMDYLTITGSFTDAGLRHLEGLKALRSLRITSASNLGTPAKDRLHKKLPNLYSFTADDDRAISRSGPAKSPTATRPTGNGSAADDSASAHPKPGTPAPDFTVTTLDGKKLTLSQHRGKVVLLHFWATWCRPCVAGLPALKTFEDNLRKKYGDRVIMINLAMDDADAKVRGLVESRKWFGPHARIGMESKLAADYGVESAPDDFMIGPDGRILLNRESPEGPGDTETVIDKALKGS